MASTPPKYTGQSAVEVSMTRNVTGGLGRLHRGTRATSLLPWRAYPGEDVHQLAPAGRCLDGP